MAMADNSEYLPQLQAEKDNLDPSFVHAGRLLTLEIERNVKGGKAEEIDRVQTGGGKDGTVMVDVTKDKPVKLQQKVLIPIKEYPKFNFVGKLLGPKGNSLKRLQEDTGTKMAILGKGSMRDKNKEEELRKEGGKYSHLNDELHVLVEVYCDPADGHSRLSHAMAELRKYLTPEEYNDEIRRQQFEEMMYENEEETTPAPAMRGGWGAPGRGAMGAPRGRGGAMGAPGRGGAMGAPGGRGGARGAPGRGGARGAPGQGRGGAHRQDYNDDIRMQQYEEMMYLNGEDTTPAPRGRGGRGGARGAPRGSHVPPIGGALLATPLGRLGHPPSRGGATPPVGRGARGGARGGTPRGRGAYGRGGAMRPPAEPLLDRYHHQHQEDSYGAGNGGYEETGYEQGGYGDPYDQGGYSSTGGDTQYFDYGHGSGGANESYEEYGDGWGTPAVGGGFGKAPPRKPADLRAHPYPGGGGRGAARY